MKEAMNQTGDLGSGRILVHSELERTHLMATNSIFLTFLHHIFSYVHMHNIRLLVNKLDIRFNK